MKKYEKMVRANREICEEKVLRAKKAIQELVDNEEPILVCDLVKRTGLSRAFFYKNPDVKSALDEARLEQKGMVFPQKKKVALDKAMELQLQMYEKQIERLKSENAKLMKEIERLSRALKRKELTFVKRL